jgi:type IV pilus assembly protein PilM
MARTRIGLDIGSTAVRAAEITLGDRPEVIRAAQVPLDPGAVENGEVRDPPMVADSIRELWQRGGFKGRQVYLGIGNQRVVVREIALPWLPEKELKASLALQVQEFIPMSVDEAVLDYDPVGEFEHDDRRMLRMLLVAAQKIMVEAEVSAVTGARLDPVGLDLIPFALVRSVGTVEEGMDLEEQHDEAILDIGAHVSNIVVHRQGLTRFVRILPSGGRDVTMAIARATGVDEEVAERLKRGETIEGAPAPEDTRPVAMQRAGAFVDEVRSSLEFYSAQTPGARIVRVLICGGGSKLGGLLELLRERIPATVERGAVFQRVASRLSLSEEAMREAEPVLAVAVGLAIPGRSP